MTITQTLIIGLVFLGVASAAMIAFTHFSPDRKRLGEIRESRAYGQPADGWKQKVTRLADPFARLSLPREGWEFSALRTRFIHAGYRGKEGVKLYFGAKTLLALGLPGIFFLLLRFSDARPGINQTMLVLLFLATLGNYLPNLVLQRLVLRRQRSIFEKFPDASDLMLVCVESGMGLDAALNKVADEMRLNSMSMAEELQLVNLEMRAGISRETALNNLAMRTGVEEVRSFTTMLVQADRFGTSIGDSLRVFAEEMRTRRSLRAEELAAKIPLKLLLPLSFCIFPSLLLVLLGPAFIQISHSLLSK